MATSEQRIEKNIARLYLRGAYLRGLEYAQNTEEQFSGPFESEEQRIFYLYYALILTALYPQAGRKRQKAYRKKLKTIQSLFQPDTPEQALICAEIARAGGSEAEAMRLYEQAVRGFHARGSEQEEALANECAARFYLDKGLDQLARAYVQDAWNGYRRVGAYTKTADLEAEYPQWLENAEAIPHPDQPAPLTAAMTRLTTSIPLMLDVMTIVQATQALSREVRFPHLIEKLMRLAIENAGATSGMLFEYCGGALLIQAKGEAGKAIETLPGIHSATEDSTAAAALHAFPLALIQAVIHRREPLILNDAVRNNPYASDAYFQARQPQAALCLPIIHQQRLNGILYLENTLTPQAFTSEQVELLKVLAAQAAISMENAALYADLEHKVAERTAEVVQAKELAETAKERFQALSEATSEGLIIHDRGKILEVNHAVEILTGYTRTELIGQKAFDFLTPESREETRRRIRSGDFGPYEVQAKKRDDTIFPIELQAREIDWQGRRADLVAVRDITWRRTLEEENRTLHATLDDRDRLGELVGRSPLMHKVYDRLLQAAPSHETVIIYGETGTGKELAARTLFSLGGHHNKTFIPVNCGTIQENLFEAQFFGYRKGAFTGAVEDSIGHVEQASDGTLFLDEVGELPEAMQVKFLRLLNDGTYLPMGSSTPHRADVRIIAATNRDLGALVRAGKVRADFFHRLHVLTIKLPPLRLHKEDIPLLAAYFLEHYTAPGAEPPAIPGALLERFAGYDWPGNVRELFNELRRYLTTGELELGGYRPDGSAELPDPPFLRQELPLNDAIEAFERFYITRALQNAGGQKNRVAQQLGIGRKTLYRKLKKYEK